MSKRLVWLYPGEHRTNIHMVLSLASLTTAGFSATVIDRSSRQENASYEHLPLGLPVYAHGSRAWFRVYYIAKYAGFLLTMLVLTLKRRPSFILVTLPQVALVGWLASIILHSRLIYYSFELFGDQYLPEPVVLKKIEALFIRRGIHALITQNEGRARVYLEERRSRVTPTIVRNYKFYRKVERSGKLRERLGLPEEWRIVIYEGTFSPGRCLDKLAQAAVYLPADTKLVFTGKITSWWRENCESLISMPSIKQKVLVSEWIPEEEFLDCVADADAGVISYDISLRNYYYGAPGKLSDYVLAGVPIVAPDSPTIAPVVERYSIGTIYSNQDPEEFARAINKVLSTPRHIWMRALERAREDLVWERQAPNLVRAISGNSRDGK